MPSTLIPTLPLQNPIPLTAMYKNPSHPHPSFCLITTSVCSTHHSGNVSHFYLRQQSHEYGRCSSGSRRMQNYNKVVISNSNTFSFYPLFFPPALCFSCLNQEPVWITGFPRQPQQPAPTCTRITSGQTYLLRRSKQSHTTTNGTLRPLAAKLSPKWRFVAASFFD